MTDDIQMTARRELASRLGGAPPACCDSLPAGGPPQSGAQREPVPRYCAQMNPLLLLRYPRLCDVRVITKDYSNKAKAPRVHLDAGRVEGLRAVIDDVGHVGCGVTPGLVRRGDA
jgi:hypothetical protein